MTRPLSGLRFALLATTALTAFALMTSPREALAACPDAPLTTINGTGSSGTNIQVGNGSALTISGTGTATVNGNQLAAQDCAIYIDSVGSTINIGPHLIQSSSEEAIVIDGDDNVITFSGSGVVPVGGTVITDLGTNDTTINFTNTTSTVGDIDMGDGNDSVLISGSDVSSGNSILLGNGNDTLTVDNSTGFSFGATDGGVGDDTLILTGTGFGTLNLVGNVGYETLRKEGTGTWFLQNGPGNFDVLEVNDGRLFLNAGTVLNINGGTTTVASGAEYFVSGTHNEAGDTIIAGTLQISPGGVYNAGNGPGDTTTIDGGSLEISAGGTYNALNAIDGSANADFLTVNGTLNALGVTVDLMGGNDAVTIRGDSNIGTLNLGTGNDILLIINNGSLDFDFTNPVDAGDDEDTLTFGGTDNFSVNDAQGFVNFEHLVKNGANTVTLETSAPTATFGDLTVNEGTLILVGDWEFTTNTITVIAGATLDIGDGVVLTVTDELGDTDVSGTLNVTNNATLNSGDGAGDVTTVFNGGVINVDTGAIPGVLNAQAVDVQAGGEINVNGTMTATSTTIAGTVNVSATGDYTTNGPMTLNGVDGFLDIDGGSVTTTGVTTLNDDSFLQVNNGGSYEGQGNTIVNQDAFLQVNSGASYTEQGNTTINDDGFIQVNNASYTSQGTTRVNGVDAFIRGFIQVNSGGTYTSQNTTFVNMTGFIQVNDGGTYESQNDTFLNDSGFIQVNGGGSFTTTGETTINADALLQINGGTYTAIDVTSVTSGTLQVLGAGTYTASATITILGGIVQGTGTINGGQLLDNNGGIVTPGVAGIGSVGTLSLVGTYDQATGANFLADLQPGGPADRFAITGSAALLGNVQFNTLAANFGLLEQYRIISTDNPIPTIFETASISGAGFGANFAWVGRVDDAGVFDLNDPSTGNNVDVIIATGPGALQGLTPNQQAVANYLGSLAVPGGVYIEDAMIYLITQIVGAGPNALDQIGGEIYDSFTTFAFETGRQYGRLVDDRVRVLRCAAPSGAPSPFCDPGTPTLLAGSSSGLGAGRLGSNRQVADTGPDAIPTPGIDSPRGFSPNTHPYGWSVWASGFGDYLSKDRTSTNLGYSGWTTGAVLGVDLAIQKRWIVGVMVGGSWSDISFSGVGGDGDLSNMGVGVYTAWWGGKWFASASFTYSKNWIEADRDLQFGTVNSVANGKTEGDQYATHATLGYGFSLRGIALEASGGIDWVRLRQYGFTETGAGLLNLSVRSRTDDSVRLRFGVRAAKPFGVRPGFKLVPEVEVGYARELMDNTRPITSSLSPIPGSFTVNGDDGSRNIVTFGAGIKAAWSQGVTLSLNYDGEWAGDRQVHGITGRLAIRW